MSKQSSLPFEIINEPYVVHGGCYAYRLNTFPIHWHKNLEIVYVYEGKGRIRMDTEEYTLPTYGIACINSEKMHCILSDDAPLYYDSIILHPDFVRSLGIPFDELQLQPIVEDEFALTIIRELFKEKAKRKPYYQSTIRADIIRLLVHLYRNHGTKIESNAKKGDAFPTLVQDTITYLRSNYRNEITVTDLAKRMGVTVNYLCNAFHEATDTTIKKYVNQLRCNDAKVMLSEGKSLIYQVAAACGYNNIAYFTRTYVAIIGEKPSDTLKAYKGNKK